jgi:hypothetical protein
MNKAGQQKQQNKVEDAANMQDWHEQTKLYAQSAVGLQFICDKDEFYGSISIRPKYQRFPQDERLSNRFWQQYIESEQRKQEASKSKDKKS